MEMGMEMGIKILIYFKNLILKTFKFLVSICIKEVLFLVWLLLL